MAGRIAAKRSRNEGVGTRLSENLVDTSSSAGFQRRPRVSLSGEAGTLSESLGMRDLDVSITHDGEFAVAAALGAFSQEVTSCSN